jgi:hypothetical protein
VNCELSFPKISIGVARGEVGRDTVREKALPDCLL